MIQNVDDKHDKEKKKEGSFQKYEKKYASSPLIDKF